MMPFRAGWSWEKAVMSFSVVKRSLIANPKIPLANMLIAPPFPLNALAEMSPLALGKESRN